MLARPWKTIPRDGNPQQVAAAHRREVVAFCGQTPMGSAAVVVGLADGG